MRQIFLYKSVVFCLNLLYNDDIAKLGEARMKSLSEKDVETTIEFVKLNPIENVAEKVLFILGFKSSLLGTKYIRDGIVTLYNNEHESYRTMYGKIADAHKTTHTCVERSIRHAINDCYKSGYLERLNELFRCQIVDPAYAPTNSEFISAICTWVHIEKNQAPKGA